MEQPELPLKGIYNPDNFKLYFGDTGLLIGSLDEEAQEIIKKIFNLQPPNPAVNRCKLKIWSVCA